MNLYRITITLEDGITILWIKAVSMRDAHLKIKKYFL